MRIFNFLLILFIATLAPAAAIAGDGTDVNFQPVIDYGLEILSALLLGLASWGVSWLTRKFKLDALAPELEKIVDEGIKFGVGKVRRFAGDKASFDVHNEAASEALNYVLRNGPKTAKKLGYSPEQLRDKILSRIEGDNVASAGSDS